MSEAARDLAKEAGELLAFLRTLDAGDWARKTRFLDWTPWDVVAHLHYFDEVSLAAVAGEEAFAEQRRQLLASVGSGRSARSLAQDALGHLPGPELLERWFVTCCELARRLEACEPKRRLPWFGPDMSAPMFATARYMETWAHAQEIYDLKGIARVHTDRIRHIVEIGIRTYRWTFVNRRLEVPGPLPFVRLLAPSGAIWEYGETDAANRIEGLAVDFCSTVTQTRHVRDTALRVEGPVAGRWMEIAQCFAGPPADPPAPGYRTGSETSDQRAPRDAVAAGRDRAV
ncbi:MAG: TIGR03084 family protein [Spirochaetaceae bacterium]|nr:TIGR03084 family protein [Myxococcales bacterium]MCB9724684.1 TIGR03084 family protein [Spirochaetaceae bacterium]